MGTNTKHIYITYLLPGRHVPTDDNNDHNDHNVVDEDDDGAKPSSPN